MTDAEIEAIENKKNMYEKFWAGELPPDIQAHLDSVYHQCKSHDEGLFKAGFMLGHRFDEYRDQLILEEKNSGGAKKNARAEN